MNGLPSHVEVLKLVEAQQLSYQFSVELKWCTCAYLETVP